MWQDGLEGFAKEAGLEEIENIKLVNRGDLCLIDNDGHKAFGVIDMSGYYVVAPGLFGAVMLPKKTILRAWKVD